MGKAVLNALRQGLGVRFFVGVLCVCAALAWACFDPLLQLYRLRQLPLTEGYTLNLMLSALESDSFAPFVPIAAVLPLSGCFVGDLKSKFATLTVVRTGYTPYLISRVIACFLLGGGVVLTGVLVSYGVLCLVLLPVESAAQTAPDTSELLERCLLAFLCGGLWALTGLALSTVMESGYIAYVSPFIVYYLLVILYERYFPNATLLYPRAWLSADDWPFGVTGAVVWTAELSALAALVFVVRGERRLRQL